MALLCGLLVAVLVASGSAGSESERARVDDSEVLFQRGMALYRAAQDASGTWAEVPQPAIADEAWVEDWEEEPAEEEEGAAEEEPDVAAEERAERLEAMLSSINSALDAVQETQLFAAGPTNLLAIESLDEHRPALQAEDMLSPSRAQEAARAARILGPFKPIYAAFEAIKDDMAAGIRELARWVSKAFRKEIHRADAADPASLLGLASSAADGPAIEAGPGIAAEGLMALRSARAKEAVANLNFDLFEPMSAINSAIEAAQREAEASAEELALWSEQTSQEVEQRIREAILQELRVANATGPASLLGLAARGEHELGAEVSAAESVGLRARRTPTRLNPLEQIASLNSTIEAVKGNMASGTRELARRVVGDVARAREQISAKLQQRVHEAMGEDMGLEAHGAHEAERPAGATESTLPGAKKVRRAAEGALDALKSVASFNNAIAAFEGDVVGTTRELTKRVSEDLAAGRLRISSNIKQRIREAVVKEAVGQQLKKLKKGKHLTSAAELSG